MVKKMEALMRLVFKHGVASPFASDVEAVLADANRAHYGFQRRLE
jgi:hypothetical protein